MILSLEQILDSDWLYEVGGYGVLVGKGLLNVVDVVQVLRVSTPFRGAIYLMSPILDLILLHMILSRKDLKIF